MAKSRETLLEELAASVRSAGQGGLTTAQDLRTFLTSLVDELLDRTDYGHRPGPYYFQVGLDSDEPGPVLMLSPTQALEVVSKAGATAKLSFEYPGTGEERLIVIGYNPETGQFTSDTRNPETDELYRIYLIGHGLLENSESPKEGDADLVFTFKVGSEDKLKRKISSQQAAEYRDEERQNVMEVTYHLNGEQTKLPFKVVAGDMLEVALTRENGEQDSIIRLLR